MKFSGTDYGKRKFSGDAERVAFLFRLYQEITSFLEPAVEKLGNIKRRQVSKMEDV